MHDTVLVAFLQCHNDHVYKLFEIVLIPRLLVQEEEVECIKVHQLGDDAQLVLLYVDAMHLQNVRMVQLAHNLRLIKQYP